MVTVSCDRHFFSTESFGRFEPAPALWKISVSHSVCELHGLESFKKWIDIQSINRNNKGKSCDLLNLCALCL